MTPEDHYRDVTQLASRLLGNEPLSDLGGSDDAFGALNSANVDTGDVLDNFDFDAFLNSNGANDGLEFDTNFAFGDEREVDRR